MPVVLPEMEELLPSLSAEQFSALERDILKNGCYAPIVVNEDMAIIDGHNRFRICEKHGLPFRMLVFSFDDLLEAKQWALDTQKGRRNLDKWELGKIGLRLKPDIETRAKANQSAASGDKSEQGALFVNSQKALPVVNTTKELAGAVGIIFHALPYCFCNVSSLRSDVFLGIAKAFLNHRLSRWFSLTNHKRLTGISVSRFLL